MFMPSMKWFKLKEVANEKWSGKHWERLGMKPLKNETPAAYRDRYHALGRGVVISNGIPTVALFGHDKKVVHVAMSAQLETLLRHARIKARRGEMPKWNWVAISQGGDVELRKLKWKARLKFTSVFKGLGKQPSPAVRTTVFAAQIQEQKRAEKMAEAKRRQEEYDKQFHEQLANDEIPAAPDWQE